MASDRSSIHFTGAPTLRDAAAAMNSSAYVFSLAPNPPPTSGAIARTLASLTPQTIARNVRRKWGIWVELYTTRSSEAGFQSATTPRVSIGTWIRRWL